MTTLLEAARKYKYGWGSLTKTAYVEGRCAKSVCSSNGWIEYQCSRKNGHGPEGLYCKQHAKQFGGDDDHTEPNH